MARMRVYYFIGGLSRGIEKKGSTLKKLSGIGLEIIFKPFKIISLLGTFEINQIL